MSSLQVRLFSRLWLSSEAKGPIELDSLRVQELFCYLMLFRERPHTREKLADLLWAGSTPPQAKQYLRQTLWQLRTTLEGVTEPDNPLVLVETEWIQVNAGSGFWLDVAEFERASNLARGTPGDRLDPSQAKALQQAVPLYRGDLLENWYQDWCIVEQERLQNIYLDMLHKLMAYCETAQRYEQGLHYGALTLRCDHAREKAHRRIMRLRCLLGDRIGALRQYDRCVEILRDEFGVTPSRRTTELYQKIQADAFDSTAAPAPARLPRRPLSTPPTHDHAPPQSLPGLLGRLSQLKRILANAQQQLDEEIEAVTRLVHPPEQQHS